MSTLPQLLTVVATFALPEHIHDYDEWSCLPPNYEDKHHNAFEDALFHEVGFDEVCTDPMRAWISIPLETDGAGVLAEIEQLQDRLAKVIARFPPKENDDGIR